jgi:parallel beta-helix repeat protein
MAEAGGVATVTARLSAVSGQSVTVNLLWSGTATPTGDFTRTGTGITIAAGSLSATITLTAVQDLLDEPNETIVVDIGSVVNGTETGTQQVTAVITDDDVSDRQLTLTYPNGGEVLDAGASAGIIWAATGADWVPGDTVTLELSTNSGTAWSPIAGAGNLAYGLGAFEWSTVGLANLPTYRIRVSWNDNPGVNDASDANFAARRCFYVNDSSTNLDEWCLAAGDDASTGADPAHPKATVPGVLSAYTLMPGDTVRIDTGVYNLSTNITVGVAHSGRTHAPVVFEASPYGVTLNRNNASSGSYVWNIAGSNVTVLTARSVRYAGVSQSWMKITGGYYGMNIPGSYCRVSRADVCSNAYYGVYIAGAYGVIENSLVRGTYNTIAYGMRVNAASVAISNCTVFGNPHGIYLTGAYAGITLRNNVICAEGAGRYAVYRSTTVYALLADYNNLHVSNGAAVGYAAKPYATLGDWRTTGVETNGMSAAPQFVSAATGDFHLQSTAGSCHGGAWTADATDSPCLDMGFGGAGLEPAPNATPGCATNLGQRNLGAYGGTEQASMTPSGRMLVLLAPLGGEYLVNQSTPFVVRWARVGGGWNSGDTVRLEYSANAGQTWSGMAGGSGVAVTNGVFTWDISGLSPGPLFLVRITCNQDESAVSQSPAIFRIGPPMVFYVNDGSTNDDEWCTAPGSEASTGVDADHPKAGVQGILGAYTLFPGDTVRIDTGSYLLTNDIVVGVTHVGTPAAPVTFEASPYGVTFNRNNTSSGKTWEISASNVTVRTASGVTHPDLPQRWMKVMGAIYGVYVNSSARSFRLSRVDVCSNSYCGVYLSGPNAVIENSLARDTYSLSGGSGIRICNPSATVSNCTVVGNAIYGLYIDTYSGHTLRNNIVLADGAGAYALARRSTANTLLSDYNNLFVTNGAAVGYNNASNAVATLADWKLTGQDTNSLAVDPCFADPAGRDFHLKSVEGRYAGAVLWTRDTAHSACIDAGDPAGPCTNEPVPHGSRVNMGAYGNTAQASRSLTNAVVALDVQSSRGRPTPEAGSSLYYTGTTLACLMADSPLRNGATQQVCTGWAMPGNEPVAGSGTNFTMTLTNNAALTWQWQVQYRLDAEAGPQGSLGPYAPWGDAGSQITLTATASNLHHFSGWIGDTNGCVITGPEISVVMDRPRALAAAFEADPRLSIVPGRLDFEAVQAGASAEADLGVQNTGGATLDGTATLEALTGPFSIIAGGTYGLATGVTHWVRIRYVPDGDGAHSNRVVFTGGGGLVCEVSGRAFGNGDFDRDGMSDWNEYLAGTSPTNAASVFAIRAVTRVTGAGCEIRWCSESNQIYLLERATNLAPDGFSTLLDNIPATPPLNVHTDVVHDVTHSYFYRIKTQR